MILLGGKQRKIAMGILIPILQIVIGCNSSNRVSAKPTPQPAQTSVQGSGHSAQQKDQGQPSFSVLRAAVCKTSVANKTFVIMPWDETAKKWNRKALTTLNWTNETQVISPSETDTMQKLVSINGAKETQSFLNGMRGKFDVSIAGDTTVVQKMTLIENFDGESFTGSINSNGGIELGGPGQPVSCGR